jgi:hypothetical protein
MTFIIAKTQKVSVNTTVINYKFGIQARKGMKNSINLDKKHGNNEWNEAIKTESKQLKYY